MNLFNNLRLPKIPSKCTSCMYLQHHNSRKRKGSKKLLPLPKFKKIRKKYIVFKWYCILSSAGENNHSSHFVFHAQLTNSKAESVKMQGKERWRVQSVYSASTDFERRASDLFSEEDDRDRNNKRDEKMRTATDTVVQKISDSQQLQLYRSTCT